MKKPTTIHDFGGFPKELFEVQYPAPGSPDLANQTKSLITKTEVGLDDKWGLDHGAWSVIKHLYPKADVPVIQMSLDYNQTQLKLNVFHSFNDTIVDLYFILMLNFKMKG